MKPLVAILGRKDAKCLLSATIFACLLTTVPHSSAAQDQPKQAVDLLISGARVYDGAGNPWMKNDVGISDGRISFIGNAEVADLQVRERLDAEGLVLTPGFIDMHTHADPEDPEGRRMLPSLYQGITTILTGVDGRGENTIAEDFARYRDNGVGVNVLTYVGFNAARQAVMGMSDDDASPQQIAAMKRYVAKGMEEGALGISTGLFYAPASYASTQEVIEVAKVSGRYQGIYDTHDRDLGAVYQGIGYLASTREGIEIGEKSGNRVIFSHFSPQSVRNYGRAEKGARLVEEARARGTNVMAAQHPYTATNSNLFSYAVPRWLVAGGLDEMLKRLKEPKLRERALRDHLAMLKIRGGAEKIVFTGEEAHLTGKSLSDVAREWNLTTLETVEKLAAERSGDFIAVMNVDLYDVNNNDYLAQMEWMMTCTDGFPVHFGKGKVHPRTYGAFPKKLREMVFEKKLISLPFAIRGMTGLAAEFIGLPDRGLIKEGFWADILLMDLEAVTDKATYEQPHAYASGMVHVLVNGKFAIKDGEDTGVLAGKPIPRPR